MRFSDLTKYEVFDEFRAKVSLRHFEIRTKRELRVKTHFMFAVTNFPLIGSLLSKQVTLVTSEFWTFPCLC